MTRKDWERACRLIDYLAAKAYPKSISNQPDYPLLDELHAHGLVKPFRPHTPAGGSAPLVQLHPHHDDQIMVIWRGETMHLTEFQAHYLMEDLFGVLGDLGYSP